MNEICNDKLALAEAEVVTLRGDDGVLRLRSPQPLLPHATTVGDWLVRWAAEAPDRTFLAERDAEGDWRRMSYGACLARVRRLSQGLLDAGLTPERPLMVLSENSIDHGVLVLAAMHVGIPVVPVSVAYSLLDPGLAKLRHIAALVQPGLVFASDKARYAKAIEAIGAPVADLARLEQREPAGQVERARLATGSDTVAKILFTSGSTGMPKGVINTQRMLTANQQQSLQVWRFVKDEPPVVLDWLPWNHTFGGNYNFNLVLSNGGTMFIDAGKPVPGQFEKTIANLREIAPTMYFNVPRGFDLLLPVLEQDREFRRHFFSRCRFVFYAAAALPENIWRAFLRIAREERGDDFVLVSSWGSTETAPLCSAVHYEIDRAGIVGLPVPGCEIKLVPNAGKLEARVRGPQVTPGYYREFDKTAAAFDEEGYYRMGDALKLDDPARPERGLVFDGRVAEDFKLASGTWVSAGKLRVQLVEAAEGFIQDAVITGHGKDEVGALVFANPNERLATNARHARLRAALIAHNAKAETGSSARIVRALVLEEPPRIDRGEITDKGYINQRFVLEARASEVSRLYAEPADTDVVVLGRPEA